ncbi:hypothetical protein DL93DRAFT_2074226 [Clavulina sp. PMI_390]|nr:hypothetical protein DL93DRAFT_2074226 [Clavulina sp. PMI_390]
MLRISFPLYSRGVDTYRFEYAVFLLNKDIEMVRPVTNLPSILQIGSYFHPDNPSL